MSKLLKNSEILTCADLVKLKNNSIASVAGFVIVKQKPSTAKGTIFLTLEDETGTSIVIPYYDKRYLKQDRVIAKIIDKKPTINLRVISSLSINEPSKIADKGLKPREIAAWVGEIN